ncbi:hypothetical protein HYH03_018385 [Edaphochlamys debaryana]|uniref:Uncharacterized protein n=1 Tax=Edaphochlamys debaryana TaxID=47281 RepID=A0A835XM37_9CHLO|nr:hypothetical protein HYH03_018385 [Edaphochlamys debaryana]|eukprot:KAG2482704.1 hypothetical protein HYH03_018385 [Edaphochlamys debaryana]
MTFAVKPVRRRVVSISSRLVQSTILDFRVRLLLLAALSLAAIGLGGLLHTFASGHSWTRSAYLVYGLLFRVPALGAVRPDEPLASAAVLNVVFLFGTFVFAILVGLIGEEVKGTIKALRAGGAPLDLYGHIVLLNFTADATAVAVLRQLAEDAARPGSPLAGRPLVVLAAPPPPAGGGGGGGGAGGGGGGGGDLEGALKRVVADALQGRRACEWHLRVGSPLRPADLARVCAPAAAALVLLADPRVGQGAAAAAAGAAHCVQAQALMCLSLALGQSGRGGGGGRGRHPPTIVVQSPAGAPLGGGRAPISGSAAPAAAAAAASESGPVATFRSLAAAEGSRAAVIEVRDVGIVDRLVAQTVLQPGVATVLARLFGSSGGEGSGFRWVEWSGAPPPPPPGPPPGSAEVRGGKAGGGGGEAGADVAADCTGGTGLRRRRGGGMPRTLSHGPRTFSSTGTGEAAGGGTNGGGKKGGALSRSTSAARSSASCLRETVREESEAEDDEDAGVGGGSGDRDDSFSDEDAAAAAGSVAVERATAAAAAAFSTGGGTTGTGGGGGNGGRSRANTWVAGGVGGGSTMYGEVRQAMERAWADAGGGSVTATAAAANGGATAAGPSRRHRASSPGGATAVPDASPSSRLLAGPPVPALPPPPPLPARRLFGAGGKVGKGYGTVVVGFRSAATGTLRLNPRDPTPVYPGDQVLLLTAPYDDMTHAQYGLGHVPYDSTPDKAMYGERWASRGVSTSDGGWGWAWGWGWLGGSRRRAASDDGGGGGASWGPAAAAARPFTRRRPAATTTGTACAPLQPPSPPAAATPSPLHPWASEPLAAPRLGRTSLPGPADGGASPTSSSAPFPATPATPHADAPAAAATAAVTAGGAGATGGGGNGNGRPAAVGLLSQAPALGPRGPTAAPGGARPQHIIVISRTAAAVREVVAGLQEFAPVGSTIALVTHAAGRTPGPAPPTPPPAPPASDGTATPPRPHAAAAAAASAAAAVAAARPSASGAAATGFATVSSFAAASQAAAAAAAGSAATLVMPCLAASWPVCESDLVAAGLSSASAVLVARDSGLAPYEADATSLSVVLQLLATLTDPTRSPLRRSPSAAAAAASVAASAAASRPATAAASRSASGPPPPLAPIGAADGGAGADAPPPLPTVPDSPRGPAAPEAPAAAGGWGPDAAQWAGGGGGGGGGGPGPLHVVVCLHSTRVRDTLLGFVAGLGCAPPFSLEALVPEEHRALLLAGVVRQPQSHAIMTGLLSDRPGAPEVYLVPPTRLLASATAAASAWHPETPDRAAADGSALPPPPPPPPPPLAGLSFRQVAAAARAAGCTAIGVLRSAAAPAAGLPPTGSGQGGRARRSGGGALGLAGPGSWWLGRRGPAEEAGEGGEAGAGLGVGAGLGCAGRLQLAPPPDMPLGLAPGDRLVVLAAEPV